MAERDPRDFSNITPTRRPRCSRPPSSNGYGLEDSIAQGRLAANADQFNSLHERLVARLRMIGEGRPLHMAYTLGVREDQGFIDYLQDCARQAGLSATPIGLGASGFAFRRRLRRSGEPADHVDVQAGALGIHAQRRLRDVAGDARDAVSERPGKWCSPTRECCRCCGKWRRVIQTCCPPISKTIRAVKRWAKAMRASRCIRAKAAMSL